MEHGNCFDFTYLLVINWNFYEMIINLEAEVSFSKTDNIFSHSFLGTIGTYSLTDNATQNLT